MRNPFLPGDVRTYSIQVKPSDLAVLDGRQIHAVLSTFALGQALEWSSRQFVEEMLEEGEEGIGTMLHIKHHAPAFEGETVEFKATFEHLEGAELTCHVEARVGERLVATGRTGQRIVDGARLAARFALLRESAD